MTFSKRLLIFPIVLTILAATALVASSSEKVKQVNANYTCFVSLKHFDEPQTAVEVNGKKYYGCHEDCTKQLTGDPKSRVAVDPVSKKEVDKADALVGVDKAGNIYFFENQRDLRKFRVPATVPPVPTGE